MCPRVKRSNCRSEGFEIYSGDGKSLAFRRILLKGTRCLLKKGLVGYLLERTAGIQRGTEGAKEECNS